MLVQDVMTRRVVTITPETTAVDALKIMKEHNFSRLPVVDDKGRLAGLVTERRLERIKPPTSTPRLLQITYLFLPARPDYRGQGYAQENSYRQAYGYC